MLSFPDLKPLYIVCPLNPFSGPNEHCNVDIDRNNRKTLEKFHFHLIARKTKKCLNFE